MQSDRSLGEASAISPWELQPAATRWVESRLEDYCQRDPFLGRLRSRLLAETGTRLFDWVDTIHVAQQPGQLDELGFSSHDPYGVSLRYHHPQALLPWVMADDRSRLVLRVDSVVDFIRAQSIPCDSETHYSVDLQTPVVGAVHASRRSAVVRSAEQSGVEVVVLERHGDQGPAVGCAVDGGDQGPDAGDIERVLESFRLRPRHFADPVQGIEATIAIAQQAVAKVGVDRACDLFFQAEREYWQLRNDAAAIQYRAQAKLGMGWSNHDHHTYRSSRLSFSHLIRLLETLGMICRERFFAGAEAGWGAQVLEQPTARIVVFADVDMSTDEVLGDFAHAGLTDSVERGTVGLWCHLHGEAVLQAGMHHLECQFNFDAARELLAAQGAESLQPFTNFAFLRQSFTRGQTWPVAEDRIATAKARGWINDEQAERFRTLGATGSHLEVLERNDGYKGFNQTGISDIIARTDPRKIHT